MYGTPVLILVPPKPCFNCQECSIQFQRLSVDFDRGDPNEVIVTSGALVYQGVAVVAENEWGVSKRF